MNDDFVINRCDRKKSMQTPYFVAPGTGTSRDYILKGQDTRWGYEKGGKQASGVNEQGLSTRGTESKQGSVRKAVFHRRV